VTPFGAPLADNITGELKPACTVMVRVTVFELPCTTETLDELGVSVKFRALASFQWFTSRFASTEPSPVARS
jgi:hypothetical protein